MKLAMYLALFGALGMFAAAIWYAIAEYRTERRRGPRTPRPGQEPFVCWCDRCNGREI